MSILRCENTHSQEELHEQLEKIRARSNKRPQDLLIGFLKWKQKKLLAAAVKKGVSNPTPYVTQEDLDEIKRWSETICIDIIGMTEPTTSHSCPWCMRAILLAGFCRDCGYGQRNKTCFSQDSRFSKVCEEVGIEAIDSADLQKRIIELKKDLAISIDTKY